MDLLLDQGLPPDAARLLRAAGWDVVHTREIGMARAADADILDLARQQGRVVVTLDADFHRLLAAAKALAPSAIRIRIPGLDAAGTVMILQQVVAVYQAELKLGAAISVRRTQVRVRPLPLT